MSTGDWFGLVAIAAFGSFFVLVGIAALVLDLLAAVSPGVRVWWRDVQSESRVVGAHVVHNPVASVITSPARGIRISQPTTASTRVASQRDVERVYRPDGRIHRTSSGELVRSKSEVIVADTLHRLGMAYTYELPLSGRKNPQQRRLPDFTIVHEGRTWYWEHLGLLGRDEYAADWRDKMAWYQANGYEAQLITSRDEPDGSIDAQEIEWIAVQAIL